MKKILSICLSLIVATVFLTHISAAANSFPDKNQSKKPSQPPQDIASRGPAQQTQVHEIGGKKIVSELRNGPAVALRAAQLRKKNKGFAKAYNALIKRGGKPVFEKAGVSVLAFDSSQAIMKKMAFSTAQGIVEGDYEMSFFPVDTGNPDVWEGLIYVKSPSGNGTYAVAHDTTHEDFSQVEVYYEDYYPGDGGNLEQVRLPRRGSSGITALAFNASGTGPALNMFPTMRDYFACVAFGLSEAAIYCTFTGPAFWYCMTLYGIGIMIACLIITW